MTKLGIAIAATLLVAVVNDLAVATHCEGLKGWMNHAMALSAVAVVSLLGFAALIGNVAITAKSRTAASRLLVTALVIAVAQPVALLVSVSVHRFLIFEFVYIFAFSICLPWLSAYAVFLLQLFRNCCGWLGTWGFVIWVLCLGLLHLGCVIQISYSV